MQKSSGMFKFELYFVKEIYIRQTWRMTHDFHSPIISNTRIGEWATAKGIPSLFAERENKTQSIIQRATVICVNQ